jgi:hypothetical protein
MITVFVVAVISFIAGARFSLLDGVMAALINTVILLVLFYIVRGLASVTRRAT